MVGMTNSALARLPLGQVAGIIVRIHVIFLLFIVVTLLRAMVGPAEGQSFTLLGLGLVAAAKLMSPDHLEVATAFFVVSLFGSMLRVWRIANRHWRCPACGGYLGKHGIPRFCHKCGVRLR